MSYTNNARSPLARVGLSIRVFFLSLLFMGCTFTFVSTLASSQTFAHGAPKVLKRHITSVKSLNTLINKRELQSSKNRLSPHAVQGHTDRHLKLAPKAKTLPTNILLSNDIPTTVSVPGINISANVVGGSHFLVGQTITLDLNIINTSSTTTFDSTSNVIIGSAIPFGLSNIVTSGSGWTISQNVTTGSGLLTAIYTGPPVAPGSSFPPFDIAGTLTSDAIPSLMLTSGVSALLNPDINTATVVVNVSSATPTATITPSPSITATTVPTVTTTVFPTATETSLKPRLYITNSTAGNGAHYVGQSLHYGLTVINLPASPAENQPITVHDIFPAGLTNIVATGNNWTFTLSSTTSPTLITGTYNGHYPIPTGTVLPMISISGNLTAAAVPSLTSDATVGSANNPNSSLNTSINTITVLAGTTPKTTITTTATAMFSATPNLSIVKVNLRGDHFNVGDKVTYVIIVSNSSENAPVGSPITVSDVIPLGLSNIEMHAPDWNVSASDTSSPAIITANYNGSLPIASGQVLSSITISGTLNKDAVPALTDTVTVDTLNDFIGGNNTATNTIFVKDGNNNNSQNSNKNSHEKNSHHHNKNSKNGNSSDASNGSDSSNSSNASSGSSGSSSSPGLPATGGSPTGDVWHSQ